MHPVISLTLWSSVYRTVIFASVRVRLTWKPASDLLGLNLDFVPLLSYFVGFIFSWWLGGFLRLCNNVLLYTRHVETRVGRQIRRIFIYLFSETKIALGLDQYTTPLLYTQH
jgi:hypothetical protein